MARTQGAPAKLFVAPSRMDWTEEKLSALGTAELKSLLENLATQRAAGRVSEEIASDLASRIVGRLPAGATAPRRKRSRALIALDTRVAESLGDLAQQLSQRYDLSDVTARALSTDTAGFRPQAMINKHGQARAGASMKTGRMAIDRFITYRVRDSLAGLAFVLGMDQPTQTGRYVVLATDDLLDSGAPIDEVMPSSGEHGWSRASRERIRTQTAADFADAQRMYEELIARVATRRDSES